MFAKVMFLQVSVCSRGAGVRGRGACMAGGCVVAACMAGGVHGGRGCMMGGVCDRGACMVGGMHGRCVCVVCMPPSRYYKIQSMSRWYAFYWNAFLLDIILVKVVDLRMINNLYWLQSSPLFLNC